MPIKSDSVSTRLRLALLRRQLDLTPEQRRTQAHAAARLRFATANVARLQREAEARDAEAQAARESVRQVEIAALEAEIADLEADAYPQEELETLLTPPGAAYVPDLSTESEAFKSTRP